MSLPHPLDHVRLPRYSVHFALQNNLLSLLGNHWRSDLEHLGGVLNSDVEGDIDGADVVDCVEGVDAGVRFLSKKRFREFKKRLINL